MRLLIRADQLKYNNELISSAERMQITISNLVKIASYQFGGIADMYSWYTKNKPAELTKTSYTAWHSWKQRGTGKLDPDMCIWIARQLGLPDLSIMGYRELGQGTVTSSNAINDAVYLDASQGKYSSHICNQFTVTGWYVIKRHNQRQVRHITRKPGGYEITNNMDTTTLDDLSSVTFLERIEQFTI